MEYTFIDLFAGAGGLALGFRDAGFRSVWAVEKDADAAATYELNFGHAVYGEDTRTGRRKGIEELVLDEIPGDALAADVIIGGPPCQGFSPLGRMSPRLEHAEMNQLWRHYLRVVDFVQPSVFVVENVPEFLTSYEGELLRQESEARGYEVTHAILAAVEHGVPQRRRRGITIASRCGTPTLDLPKEEQKTVRDAIGDLPREPNGVNWHIGRNPLPKSVARYQAVPPGGNRFDLMRARPDLTPRCWKEKPTGSTDVFGRLEWHRPALTIRTEFFKPEKGRYLHPEAHRPITHREAMRIQTFPDDFEWVGSKTSVAKQVGNAVPPKLANTLALAVKALLERRPPESR